MRRRSASRDGDNRTASRDPWFPAPVTLTCAHHTEARASLRFRISGNPLSEVLSCQLCGNTMAATPEGQAAPPPDPYAPHLNDYGEVVIDDRTWDGPDAWRGVRIVSSRGASRCDDFIERCPLFCEQYGLREEIWRLYADDEGYVVEALRSPLRQSARGNGRRGLSRLPSTSGSRTKRCVITARCEVPTSTRS